MLVEEIVIGKKYILQGQSHKLGASWKELW